MGNGRERRLFSPFAAANASSRTHILPRTKRDGTAGEGLDPQKEENKPCIFYFFWNEEDTFRLGNEKQKMSCTVLLKMSPKKSDTFSTKYKGRSVPSKTVPTPKLPTASKLQRVGDLSLVPWESRGREGGSQAKLS